MLSTRHPYLLIPTLLCLLVTVACTLGAGQTPGTTTPASATPDNPPTIQLTIQPSSQPTNSPTSTPTPSPSPTPPPAARLAQATQALHNGDYQSALAEYQAVASDSGSAEQVEAAWFGLGEAALRQGDLVAAENALTRFIEAHPNSSRLADAWFLLAETRYASGNFTGAVDAYREYLELRGEVIESYVQERIGEAYDQAGDTAAAIEAYRRAIVAAPDTSIAAAQREKLALIYRLSGDFESAIEQYQAILEFAQIDSYRAHVMLSLGQTLLDSGDDSGYDFFRALIDTYPRTGEAYDALVLLVNAGATVDAFQRGLVDYYAGQYEAAIAALSDFIDSTADHADAHFYLAMSYRAADNTPAALRQFDTLIEDHPDSQFWGQAWIEKAIAQSLGGELDAAIETLTRFAEDYPSAALAPNALLRAGLLLERAGEYGRAAEMYGDVQATFPSDPAAPDALFAAGVNAYRDDDTRLALSAWQSLSNTHASADPYPAALLWQGKLALNTDDRAKAQALLDTAAQARPFSYYSIRAAELRDNLPILQSLPFNLQFDAEAERAEAEAWLTGWIGQETESEISLEIPQSVLDDGRYQRGAELWRLGRLDQAKSEFEGLRAAVKDDPIALYALSLYWRDIGLYRSSLMAAARLIAISPAGTAPAAPAFIARLAYPTYYADLVVPEADARGLDPLLVFSIIRQESLFEGIATSSAFANGLMQIIPSTGEEIATALNWPNYRTAELYKPYVSVVFGAYYLARQRDYLEGDLYAALAAYNGGPGNAVRWHEIAHGDPDLFLETITLNETRTYLLRIREHLAMYQLLYGSGNR
ncbi:MAG TPA: tetratricopeptide repeat protein [Anaerolineae bacterium]|nr:tetratricopeptide repeat protein [Anaerolineae bacterium]